MATNSSAIAPLAPTRFSTITGWPRLSDSFVHELVRSKNVPDEVFTPVHKLLGVQGVVDLTLTCSYYTGICLAQIALESEMEPGRTSTL